MFALTIYNSIQDHICTLVNYFAIKWWNKSWCYWFSGGFRRRYWGGRGSCYSFLVASNSIDYFDNCLLMDNWIILILLMQLLGLLTLYLLKTTHMLKHNTIPIFRQTVGQIYIASFQIWLGGEIQQQLNINNNRLLTGKVYSYHQKCVLNY